LTTTLLWPHASPASAPLPSRNGDPIRLDPPSVPIIDLHIGIRRAAV
jgi:hypothetical protein